MRKQYVITLIVLYLFCFSLCFGQNSHKADTIAGNNLSFSYALDTGLYLNHITATIGLSALFRFYIQHLLPSESFIPGCITGIVYEHSSSNTYTLHSFPLLVVLQSKIPLPPVQLFWEIGVGPAFNYELMPISYFYVSPALEAKVGCNFAVYDNLRIGFWGGFYINDVLDIILRSAIGGRGEFSP